MPPRSSTKRKATTASAPESDVDDNEQQQKPQRKSKGKAPAGVNTTFDKDDDDEEDEAAASSSKPKKPKKAAAAKEPVQPLDASLPTNTTFPIELKLSSKAEGTSRLSCWNGALSVCAAARIRFTDVPVHRSLRAELLLEKGAHTCRTFCPACLSTMFPHSNAASTGFRILRSGRGPGHSGPDRDQGRQGGRERALEEQVSSALATSQSYADTVERFY